MPLRIGERPPLDAVEDPVLPVPRASERLDPRGGLCQVRGAEVEVDADLAVLRFGDALDTERGKVVATPEDEETAVVEFLFPLGIEHRAQKSAIRSASCASIVM
ncbi:MAG TPA: hypothetical protein VF907_00060 [Actinomycetota bacterium]